MCLFICLHQALVAACGILGCSIQTPGCSRWDLVPWPGIKLWTPCIGSVESWLPDHQEGPPHTALLNQEHSYPILTFSHPLASNFMSKNLFLLLHLDTHRLFVLMPFVAIGGITRQEAVKWTIVFPCNEIPLYSSQEKESSFHINMNWLQRCIV